MFGKKVKKIAILLSSIIAVSGIEYAAPTYAAVVERAVIDDGQSAEKDIDTEKGEYVDVLREDSVLTCGASKPTGTSYVDIKNNDYKFEVESMTVGLYTNSFFSGSTKVKVTVGAISVDKNGMRNESKGITVHLRKKGSSIDVTYSVSLSGESFYYKNLDSSALYYLEFTKQNDSQIYSFSGTISDAEDN